jgi:hypothetical protein
MRLQNRMGRRFARANTTAPLGPPRRNRARAPAKKAGLPSAPRTRLTPTLRTLMMAPTAEAKPARRPIAVDGEPDVEENR